MYDEFFGIEESEQYAFYRVPKLLFTTDRFWNLSTDAKMLYGLLLDRMALSQKNGWVDEQGHVYIIYTIENIMEALGCGNKKAIGLLAELENKANLILRKKQGLGKPNLIYVKKFTVVANTPVERHFLKCQNDTSGNGQSTSLGVSKEHSNNTDINNTEFSNTDPFFSSDFCGKEVDGTADFQRYHQYFYEQLYMEYLKKDFPYDHDTLDLILHLIVEVMCSKRKQIRIASDDKPIEIVRSTFMKLDSEHIRFVMDSFKENTTDVRNIKQYLLASIYNAPYTIACLILSDMEQAVWDEASTTYETELWLMEDMSFFIVRCVTMKVGSDGSGYVTEYRAFKKALESADDLFFSPEKLIEELEAMCVPQWEHEATIYEL